MSYTDVFGNTTVVPSKLGYQALSLSADTTTVWPYDSAGGTTISKIMDISATTGGLSLTFPDARDVSNGEDVLIRNVGANTFTVKDASGATVGTVASGAAKYFYVTDNSTAAGAIAAIAYGVGTSAVDAATLIGYGIIASGSTLNQSHPVSSQSGNFTITAAHRAALLNYTGGTGTAAVTAAATLGDNFFCLLRNSGTGVLTIDPSGAELIDNAGSVALQPGESTIVACSGAAHYTVGLGRSVTYNFTQLVKDVSAAGSFTLSAAEASNKLIKFIGNPASAVTIVVPNTVAVYYTLSAISTAQTITVKTAAGTGTALSNGSRAILICDGSEVYSAQTADISTLVSLPDGSAAAPSLNFTSTTTTGLYKYGATGFGLAVGGVARYTDDGTTTTIGALSGLVKRASGVESAAVAGTDYVAPGGALGTPSSGTLTNCTGLPQAGVTGLTTADSPQFAGVNIGHASDTTLTRVSAGVVAVEGSNVLLASGLGSVTQAYDANTAKLNVDQSWTGSQRGAITTDNDGSFDLNAANNFSCTPASNVALTFTNHTAGQSGFVLFINTGGYTGHSLAATTKADSNFLSIINATGTYLIAYFDNGTNTYVTTTGALS